MFVDNDLTRINKSLVTEKRLQWNQNVVMDNDLFGAISIIMEKVAVK